MVATDRDLKMDLEDLAKTSGRGSQERLRSVHGGRHRRDNGGRRDRSFAGSGALLPTENLWFHVDAAWGGAAIISPRSQASSRRNRSRGFDHLRRAQMVLGADGSRDVLLPASRKPSRRPFAPRLPTCRGKQPGRSLDPYTTSAQWSRRFIGLKLFLALAQHGESGYVEMIEHQARMGDVLRESLQRTGWRIVNTTPLPLVCFTREGSTLRKFLAALHEAPDRVDVGSPARRRRSGPAGMHHQFSNHRADIEWVVSEMNRLAAK